MASAASAGAAPGPGPAPAAVRFCARCATPMRTAVVCGTPRRTCPGCGFVHYPDPKVGVGVAVVHGGGILLVRRAIAPERGKWSIPAGYLDAGEDPRVAAVREVREETGLRVTVDPVLGVFHDRASARAGGASVFLLFEGRYVGGALCAGDDASAAAFFGPDELPELAFPSTAAAVARLLAPLPC